MKAKFSRRFGISSLSSPSRLCCQTSLAYRYQYVYWLSRIAEAWSIFSWPDIEGVQWWKLALRTRNTAIAPPSQCLVVAHLIFIESKCDFSFRFFLSAWPAYWGVNNAKPSKQLNLISPKEQAPVARSPIHLQKSLETQLEAFEGMTFMWIRIDCLVWRTLTVNEVA